jgi:hypothetical protein
VEELLLPRRHTITATPSPPHHHRHTITEQTVIAQTIIAHILHHLERINLLAYQLREYQGKHDYQESTEEP